jgi:PAS domain S-box-containing protein
VYALDAEDRITLVNDALTTVTGYDRGDLQGAHVSLLMDDDVAARRELVQDLLDRGGGATETLEADLITADGDRIPCETQVGVLTDDGEFAGTTGVIRDISNRNRRERRLRELQRTTRDLIDADTRPEVAEQTAETVVSVLDHPIAGLRLCSDDGERLLPVAMRDAVRTAMGDRPTYAADAAVPAARAFREGETIVVDDFETVDDEPDRGDVRSALYVPVARHGVLCVGDTATDAFGEMERSLAEVLTANAAAMIDRVEQERTSERRLERVEELLSVLSHDLKNLINVAAGRIDLANTGDDNLDAAADALERVDAVIDDAITLVRQGERINEWDHVSLTDTVHDVWRTAGGDAATLSIEGDLGTVACDESGLQQLLENLFRNAVEHGGPAVTVRVGALEEGFYVSDDGPGIPESEREEVFESRYTTAADGTGFGLAIVRSIAEAHGWRIRCTESESGGARFEFHIENEPPSRLDPVQ